MMENEKNGQLPVESGLPQPVQEEAPQPVDAAPQEEDGKGKKKGKKEKEKKSLGRNILEWIATLLTAVILALVVRSLCFELVKVDGQSMQDTLENHEVMFVTKFEYASVWATWPFWDDVTKTVSSARAAVFGNPARFDVVICRYPGRGDLNFVKRVVGLPGDTVKIEDGYLYVNGEKYDEPYISDEYRVAGGSNGRSFAECTVPKAGAEVKVVWANENHSQFMVEVNGGTWSFPNLSEAENSQGDVIMLIGRSLYLNGKQIESAETLEQVAGQTFTLREDNYIVMGDHRNNSNDSRAQGPIPRTMIYGHAAQVIWPLSSWRGIPNGLDVK